MERVCIGSQIISTCTRYAKQQTHISLTKGTNKSLVAAYYQDMFAQHCNKMQRQLHTLQSTTTSFYLSVLQLQHALILRTSITRRRHLRNYSVCWFVVFRRSVYSADSWQHNPKQSTLEPHDIKHGKTALMGPATKQNGGILTL